LEKKYDLPEARSRLIFPLDEPNKDAALAIVGKLAQEVGLFKVGLELYLAQGPTILADISSKVGEGRIFLDLKLYDIPNTIQRAIRVILKGLALITVPSDLGPATLKAVAASQGFTVLAVTLLTSSTGEELKAMGYKQEFWENPSRLVIERAIMAQKAGCRGVVCSGREARAVKEACGQDFLVVCPGIRPAWSVVAGDDQRRVVTPFEAMHNGADYIVVGRPIRTASDPVAAARRVAGEIAEGLAARE
jgi:orotidine-5'-phosphate decarboxylase